MEDPVTTPRVHRRPAGLCGAWQPGQSGNPKGRPKGSRHKLGEAFIEAMHEDFKQHGADVITKVRLENPEQYLKIIASMLPKELSVKPDGINDLDDGELAHLLAVVRAIAVEIATLPEAEQGIENDEQPVH